MQRRIPVVAGLAAVILALVVWRCRTTDTALTTTTAGSSGSSAVAKRTVASQPRPDPTKLLRSSLAGTITDETKAAVPHARVCADGSSDELPDELLREPTCADSDAQGKFKLENLYPAKYVVSAAAKPCSDQCTTSGGAVQGRILSRLRLEA